MSLCISQDGCGYAGCLSKLGSTSGFIHHTNFERCPKRDEDFKKAKELGDIIFKIFILEYLMNS